MKKIWYKILRFFNCKSEHCQHWTVFNMFKKKPDYKALYEEQKKMTEKWEFRYNKLYRQLMLICRDAEERVNDDESTRV